MSLREMITLKGFYFYLRVSSLDFFCVLNALLNFLMNSFFLLQS